MTYNPSFATTTGKWGASHYFLQINVWNLGLHSTENGVRFLGGCMALHWPSADRVHQEACKFSSFWFVVLENGDFRKRCNLWFLKKKIPSVVFWSFKKLLDGVFWYFSSQFSQKRSASAENRRKNWCPTHLIYQEMTFSATSRNHLMSNCKLGCPWFLSTFICHYWEGFNPNLLAMLSIHSLEKHGCVLKLQILGFATISPICLVSLKHHPERAVEIMVKPCTCRLVAGRHQKHSRYFRVKYRSGKIVVKKKSSETHL